MTKALLILAEMPENCLDCDLADCRYISNAQNYKMPYGIYCTAKEWKIADSWLDLKLNDKRPDWCPLKELPARMGTDDNGLMGAFVAGYNECLEEIEGAED